VGCDRIGIDALFRSGAEEVGDGLLGLVIRIGIGIVGGYLISMATGIMIPSNYVEGLFLDFRPYSITYSLIKSAVFAFIITSISAFFGYYAKGNSLEVGKASTRAVVVGSVVIMIFNLILTQILLI
jgi:phospholipid/cholesterol/gamma-HCH transport system permease protein